MSVNLERASLATTPAERVERGEKVEFLHCYILTITLKYTQKLINKLKSLEINNQTKQKTDFLKKLKL